MDSGVFVFFLPVILAFMMMGLGLELTVKDFLRVGRYPKAIFLALFCQLVILTSIAFFICVVLDLEPLLAVGLMLLAASPGGPTANLLSFLFKGDVALNLTLTAINSVITTFTLPFIVNLSLHYFMQSDTTIGIQADKFAYIFLIIFIPVCIGLLIRHYFPHLALKCNRPMRMLCILFLTAIFIYALFRERSNVILYFVDVGIAVGIFCFSSMFIGYLVPHLAGLTERQARACAFEIGIHNTAISITIAISVLSSTTIAIPAGVYSIYMYLFAFGFGYILTRKKSNLLSNQVKP
ncbi:bile acid:sodium symporter family protein [Acinetobacter cumulans]|uniref:Bile acid:sodium symporter family protein n=1 Tax=Acinetobacter cumulans TaxID=2136182 RepID=A0ABX9UAK7_9GAMM|nr:bile acid:sodium symporter family protein [Acinetobacter cumulans]RLL50273.1 bile acid:sodium symporter family protein [Acinetobacter cumulans]